MRCRPSLSFGNNPDLLWTAGLVVTPSARSDVDRRMLRPPLKPGGVVMSKRRHKRKQGKSVEGRLRVFSPHVDGFRSWLQRNGYRPTTIVEVVRLTRLLG